MNFTLYATVYTVTILGFFVVALLVGIRRGGKEYEHFALFAFLIGIWQMLQFIAQLLPVGTHGMQALLLKLSVAVISFVGVYFLRFAAIVAAKEIRAFLYLAVASASGVAALFSGSLQDAQISHEGIAVPSIDVFYGLPLLFAAACVLYGLSMILSYLRSTRHGSRERTQAVTLLAGVLQGTVIIALFSIVANDSLSSQVAIPIACLIAVIVITYAIVFQGLFDIRLAIARTVGYLLSLSFVGLLYGIFMFSLSSLYVFNQQNIEMQRVEYVGLALVTALLYSPAERFFARITNRVFYQDAYDPQQLFNELNKVLVANAELVKLLTKVLQVIGSTFKTESSAIALATADPTEWRIVNSGNREHVLAAKDIADTHGKIKLANSNYPVLVTDLISNNNEVELVRQLRRQSISVLAPLLEDANSSRKLLGYIVMGPKKSGRPFTKQDAQVLEAIANEMVIAVQNALRFEEIEKFNITLQEEVERATSRLRRANKRLEELDNTKDDFISMASHQLRTPLTSVKGYLSMVIEGDAGKINPTQAKMLSQAFSSAQRMVFLITDLLNVSRLKTGKFVIDPVPVDLAKMVQEEVEQLTETASSKQLVLSYKRPAKFPELMLDATKIRQVVMNFIDNAIYYTPAGGHIRIELEDNPQTVELRVIDDGIGVPKAEQHHLFTKFYRAANARQTRPDGTGLGLFMAQKVIVAQSGSIIFSSKEGQGSTFGFVFSKSHLKPVTVEVDHPTAAAETKPGVKPAPVR